MSVHRAIEVVKVKLEDEKERCFTADINRFPIESILKFIKIIT